MAFKFSKTQRGFSYFTFRDQYGIECSLQKSSLAEPDCVWLGVDYTGEKIHPVTGAQLGHRMHLTRESVQELIQELQVFVDTGKLRKPEPEFDYEKLSPNIRKLVKLLHYWGYETTDSGDGTNAKEGMECAVPEPMVVVQIASGDLVGSAQALVGRLYGVGVKMGVGHRRVDASYSSEDDLHLLLVLNVTDEDLD